MSKSRCLLALVFLGSIALVLALPTAALATNLDLFVVNQGNETIGKYTTSGATVNPALISGLNVPRGIAISGSDLFVTHEIGFGGTLSKYATSRATVAPSLIGGLGAPWGIAVSGSDLFVTNASAGTIGEYTTSGKTVNPALISGLNAPFGIAVATPEPSTMLLFGSGLLL